MILWIKKNWMIIVAWTKYLDQSFPRLGSLRGCERAHVLVLRTYKHLASVHSRVEKVRPHERCWEMLSRCVSPTEKNMIKQLNWDYPPCAGFKKRYVGRIVACLKNTIGSFCPICDPNLYNQKGYFKQKKWKRQWNKVITSWKSIWALQI